MRERLQSELEATRASFQALLDSLSEGDFHKQSNNPGWTNGEILFHMTLGFILIPLLAPLIRFFGRVPDHYSRLFARFLNFGTTLFNWFNALGARIGGSIYTRQRIGGEFDRAYSQILRLLDSIGVDEWQLGMYYPKKWCPQGVYTPCGHHFFGFLPPSGGRTERLLLRFQIFIQILR